LRIGVFCPNWVGDAIMSFPFFHTCKKEETGATILAICKSWVAPLFENHPLIDGIVSFNENELKGIRSTGNAGRSIRALELDKFYLLSDSYRAAYLAKKSETVHRIGYRGQGRSGLLTQIVSRPKKKMHRSQQYVYLLNQSQDNMNLNIFGVQLSKEEKHWARNELAQLRLSHPIAFSPFSIASSRSIPQLKILEMLEITNETILIFGGKEDKAKGNILVEASTKKNIYNVAGHYGLRDSMALISQCKGAVATDSGLGHISANLGVPTVSLFGAGDPEITGPIGMKTIIINKNVHCSPCIKNKCYNQNDPLLCLNEIQPEYPWDLLTDLMNNSNSE